MQKGYSKEIMEALFKEEQQKQAEEQAEAARKKQKQAQQLEQLRQVLLQEQQEKFEKELETLRRQVGRLRIGVIVAVVLALIAAAIGLNSSIKEWMLLLP